MSKKTDLTVMVSLDVEEEGLFGGMYAKKDVTVNNVAWLKNFTPFMERGIKPTLFCAHSVFASSAACDLLQEYRDKAEIAAHLHYWNTPPLDGDPAPLKKAPAGFLDSAIFAEKLETLLGAAQKFLGYKPHGFRMGRWDIHAHHWEIIVKAGILADASVRPLHFQTDAGTGPDHFLAPVNPYWIKTPVGEIFEVPLTVSPLLKIIPHLLSRTSLAPLRRSLYKWGALTLLPVYHPQPLMRLATLLHTQSGGKVISLTWHSSEMMPGGAPHMPNQKSVQSFLAKLKNYFKWLENHYNVAYQTLSQIRSCYLQKANRRWHSADADYGKEISYA